jgi:hypothetical protein
MGGKPALLLAGKVPTSTQSDWVAETRGTSYRLLHFPGPCACPPLEGRISDLMSRWNLPRGFPSDFPMAGRAQPAHSDADNLLGAIHNQRQPKPI